MLVAIYKTGSQCILPNAKDNDLVMFYETKEEARKAFEKNKKRDCDYHFDSIENLPHIFIGCYLYPFMELVDGVEIPAIKNFSIFEHETEYKELLKTCVNTYRKEYKSWYHIVIAYYMFTYGKMKLTKTQLKVAQQTHDKGVSAEMYDTLVEYFN